LISMVAALSYTTSGLKEWAGFSPQVSLVVLCFLQLAVDKNAPR